MSGTISMNTTQKQTVRAVVTDAAGNPDTTTPLSFNIGAQSVATAQPVQGDNRAIDVIAGSQTGSTSMIVTANGKSDTVGITITAAPDLSAINVSPVGSPVPK